ncbi:MULTISPECIES: SDR family NAD(P)-dependent oxidoreductase [Shinella]|uniref:SDR family NAD(P)-dependent oxidoreductase n=1 Tax=Shinella TaxID=323620 RepID=UPI00225CF20F|nr:SDR family NAD(P)-dependent oxidoreductase [Shinella sp. YE25]MDC7259479.1 SDR family oxidoreductase [Shinella sp. YE25]CAI0341245.1 hypothetical protein SHINE37_70050 [Rhizobiaceae bacterium]CAK7260886.1 protein of unknown function [Shinella sp. WSC3-e]
MRRLEQREFGGLCDAAARVEREFGRIDILFANAGVQALKPILDMDDADWHDQIDVNLTGTANAIRAFGPAMVRRWGGRMILTSSTQGQHGTKSGAAYSASKWGVIGLMKSTAMDLGEHGITVNALIPGLIDTGPDPARGSLCPGHRRGRRRADRQRVQRRADSA